MARKTHDDALGVVGAETIIGTGVVVHGNLESESDIIIDATLDGHIKAAGDVAIGINAHINGNITGTNVTVAGTINGNITADGEARIAESGHVKGDITANGIAISSGGVFIGTSHMESGPKLTSDESSDPNEPEKSPTESKPQS